MSAGNGYRVGGGSAVDLAKPLAFRFNGVAYQGFAGDTLASALLANGVHFVGRSFKYHRPRGFVGSGYEDMGGIVQLAGREDRPNVLAACTPLYHGLEARSVNCWPSLRLDIGALARLAAPLLPAGFYYKTFQWPDWHLYEPSIRRAAGLGRAPRTSVGGDAYESRYGHCDVLVVGAGPAGLMAALNAARAGARVFLADDGLAPGGRLTADARRIDDAAPATWIAAAIGELAEVPTVRVFRDATVWGYLEHNYLAMVERQPAVAGLLQRNWRIRAQQVVIAAGALERPIPFAGSDRPGVMLASAARAYLNRFGVLPGRRVVVFTNNNSAYEAATDLARAGARVTLVDSRADIGDAARACASASGISMHAGAVLSAARGAIEVRSVKVANRASGRPVAEIDCDLVCTSGGWNPAFHLASQSREARAVWHDGLATFVPEATTRRFHLAGAAKGTFGTALCLAEGAEAGVAAARAAGFTAKLGAVPAVEAELDYAIDPLWHVPARSRRGKVFVDLVNDVTVADLALALREGYEGMEHVKRYTTAGMGIDQGKTGNVTAIATVAMLKGVAPHEVGTTTFRQPYVPVEFGAIAGHRAGERLSPIRRTPITAWNVTAGAVMYEAGLRWQRPGYYPKLGETMEAATLRESRAVRDSVGVYDASTLGKFLLKGPDAVALLDLLYVNAWGALKPGHGRYGVMLSEDGLILDDGVTFCLGENLYLLHSSTGGADRVYAHIEKLLQYDHPDLRVAVLPITSQWANVTVCGPRTREVIEAAGTDIAIGKDAFPFMALRTGAVAGLPVRAARVSWTGELSIELNTPARHGLELWERVLKAGEPFGIAPVGSEASHLLRIEAGYISTGHEADGTADVHDLGLGWMVSKAKRDFVGKRAMEMRRRSEPVRRELVGFLPENPARPVPEGCPITPGGARGESEGLVTACTMSVALKRTIALGLLRNGRARIGDTVFAREPAGPVAMRVVEPVFHDRDRSRVKG
jgi:sarcosine oxidase subunit alpha